MQLSKIFKDGIVFQANKPIRVFGVGKGNASVEIDSLMGDTQSTNDNWYVELPAHNYGGPYTLNVKLNDEKITINDVWFGDVYLMAGQSNMGFPIRNAVHQEPYHTSENIRMYRLNPEQDSDTDFNDCWRTLNDNCIGSWSALAYFLGLKFEETTQHKIAFLMCEKGASVIQSFMPEGYYSDMPCGKIPDSERSIDFRIPDYTWNYDGCLYNRMFVNIIPFNFKCVVWYQGEGNASGKDPEFYDVMLKEFINCWREKLQSPELPFVIVQIAEYDKWPDLKGWDIVKKMQEKTVNETDNTYLVKSADVCETNEIHPPTKDKLAFRIADVILKM